mgnify:CR=1 FL=1
MSHTIRLELPDTVYELLQKESKLNGKSPTETIVEKITSPITQKTRARDPFFANNTVYEGEVPSDGSLNHDKYICEEPL